MTEDYYSLLGIEPDASEEAVLEAYRQRAAEHHPDVSEADDAEDTFQRLHRAKDVLTDDQRRREYDRVGHERFVEREDGAGGGSRGSPVSVERETTSGFSTHEGRTTGFDTLVQQLVGEFAQAAGGRRKQRRTGHRTTGQSPFTIDLTAVLGRETPASHARSATDRAATSSTATRSSPDQVTCPKCEGRGTFEHLIDTARGRHRRLEDCERCGGTGAISR